MLYILLRNILYNIYSYKTYYILLRTFSWEFSQIFQSSFFNTSRWLLPYNEKPCRSSRLEVFFKIAVLKYLRKLPGNYPSWSSLLAKIKKSTPPQTFRNSFSNIFERLHLHKRKPSRRLSHIISEAAVHGGVLLLGKIKIKYTTTDVFQGISLNLPELLL